MIQLNIIKKVLLKKGIAFYYLILEKEIHI